MTETAHAVPDAGRASGATSPFVPVTLRHRRDFLRAAGGRRQATPGFVLQALRRDDGDPAMRVGFTCSRKVGNAVTRNRARRRLRSLARAVVAAEGHSGWDYVLIGRPEGTVSRPFAEMAADLSRALRRVHGERA
jgi:ribonuclease P protein component